MHKTWTNMAAFGALLLAGSAVIAAEPARKLDEDKVICKKSVDTGSLIRGKKRCLTRKQWADLADATREQLMQGSQSGSQGGSN